MAKQSQKSATKTNPAPQPAAPQKPPEPSKPPDRRYSMTELAVLCGVTEQTVRRWWMGKLIPAPIRHGRTVYWMADVGNVIIDTYIATGKPAVTQKAGA